MPSRIVKPQTFTSRLYRLVRRTILALIVTSGGSVSVGVILWKAPITQIFRDGVGGAFGFIIGIAFCVGTAISVTVFWLVTGRNAGDVLFGSDAR